MFRQFRDNLVSRIITPDGMGEPKSRRFKIPETLQRFIRGSQYESVGSEESPIDSSSISTPLFGRKQRERFMSIDLDDEEDELSIADQGNLSNSFRGM